MESAPAAVDASVVQLEATPALEHANEHAAEPAADGEAPETGPAEADPEAEPEAEPAPKRAPVRPPRPSHPSQLSQADLEDWAAKRRENVERASAARKERHAHDGEFAPPRKARKRRAADGPHRALL